MKVLKAFNMMMGCLKRHCDMCHYWVSCKTNIPWNNTYWKTLIHMCMIILCSFNTYTNLEVLIRTCGLGEYKFISPLIRAINSSKSIFKSHGHVHMQVLLSPQFKHLKTELFSSSYFFQLYYHSNYSNSFLEMVLVLAQNLFCHGKKYSKVVINLKLK